MSAFSMLLYMADTLNNDAAVALHEPVDTTGTPGFWSGKPWALSALNTYVSVTFSVLRVQDGRCARCGQMVTQDNHGSWVDSTGGDGCDSGVHSP